MVHLPVQLRFQKAAPKDALSNLHKDTEGAFEVALKVALKVTLEVALKLRLYCTC